MNLHRPLFAIALTAVLLFALAACEKVPSETEQPAQDGAATEGTGGEWKVAGSFSSTLPVLGPAAKRAVERINAQAGGRLQLQLFEPGKLVAPLEVLDAVGEGTVEAGMSLPASWYDRMPAVAFFASPPFGPDAVEYLAWLYEGDGLKLWREVYAERGVVPVPCGYVPPEASGWFRKPVSGQDPFKGVKIHFYGLGGQVLQKLGAQVLLLSAEDIYPALERGVLDAAQVSGPAIDSKMGLGKVAKHYYFPGWHQQASSIELLVNQERWDGLAEADRAMIDAVCRETLATGIASAELAQSQALADLQRQGVEIHYWSDEQLQVFRNAYDEVLKEMRIKDETFKRVHDAYLKFRESYAQWRKLSRQPRGF